uniref:RNA-directed RNA polymerase n=1 Tax=viral metagenome TaxID=1070528 RepID=A0A8J9SUC7_9ZZZZ
MSFLAKIIQARLDTVVTEGVKNGRVRSRRGQRDLREYERLGLRGEGSTHPERKSTKMRKSHRKVKHRSQDTGRLVLPEYEGPVSTNLDTSRLYGVLMPMGHGKSHLCSLEGWIDSDALVPDATRSRMFEDVYEELGEGRSYDEALRHINDRARKALELLNPPKPTLILSSSLHFLKSCGVDCVIKIVLCEEAFESNISSREEHEKVTARLSRKTLLDSDPSLESIIELESNKQVYEVLYQVCDALQLPVGAPKELGQGLHLPGKVGSLEHGDMDLAIDCYDRGEIERNVVDYQINAHGLRSYRGFGFTINDWAQVAGHIIESGGIESLDEPVGDWPLTLGRLSKKYDLSDDQDAQLIIRAHEGEPEAFVTSLLVHWKMYGRLQSVDGRVLFLYLVRLSRWDTVMKRVRSGVLSSGTYMGEPITLTERELLLSMHMLSCTTRPLLRRRLTTDQFGCPNNGPGEKLRKGLSQVWDKLAYKPRPLCNEAEATVRRLLKQGKSDEVRCVPDAIDGLTVLRRKDLIAYALGCYAAEDWAGEKGWQVSVSIMMRQIISNWYRLGRIKDEWLTFTSGILNELCEPEDKLSFLVAEMVARPSGEGASGLEWSNRTADALQQVVVTGWAGVCLKKDVVLAEVGGRKEPKVLGASEEDIWTEIMRLGAPKFILSWVAGSCNNVQLASELIDWSQSATGYIMELANAGRWLGKHCMKDRVALLSNWIVRKVEGCDEVFQKQVLELYAKAWLGRRLSEKLCEELHILRQISRRDGGYGIGTVYHGKVQLDKDGAWTGSRGSIRLTGKSKLTDACSVHDLQEALSGTAVNTISSTALALSGALVVTCMAAPDKKGLNSACRMLERLRDSRPSYSDRLTVWQNIAAMIQEIDNAVDIDGLFNMP